MELERSTLADWVGAAARLLAPLEQTLGRQVVAAEKLHADDTPVDVLQPERGTTKTRRLWTYDGYAGFERLYEGGKITEAARWAHVRRKFCDLEQAQRSPIAAGAVCLISVLYGIEAKIPRSAANRRTSSARRDGREPGHCSTR